MFGPKRGKRNSRLLKKSPFPPIGKPVGVVGVDPGVGTLPISRGPAWLSPKPRIETLPPPKNRSGSGIASNLVRPDGILNGMIAPNWVCRAKTRFRPIGVYVAFLARMR